MSKELELIDGITSEVVSIDQINVMKEAMRNTGIKVEFDLMNELENMDFGVKQIVKGYLEDMEAMTTNKFGEKEPDTRSRLVARKELLKIMTGNLSNLSKTNITINTQNNVWGTPVDQSKEVKF